MTDLVKETFKNNISTLRSIEFSHAAYFLSNKVSQNLMNQVKDAAEMIQSNDSKKKFPMNLKIHSYNLFTSSDYIFVINEEDKDYVVSLNKAYNFLNYYFKKHLKARQSIDKMFLRFLYFIPNYDQRCPKSIHYTKNVKSIFTHDALSFTAGSIILNPDYNNGHFNSHYRSDISDFYKKNIQVPIRRLGIDFEFGFFLIKNSTDYCST